MEENTDAYNIESLYNKIAALKTILKENSDNLANEIQLLVDGETNTNLLFDSIVECFKLSSFEKFILLFCIAIELDHEINELLYSDSDTVPLYAIFVKLVQLHSNPHWSAINTEGVLCRYRLITIIDSPLLIHSTLRVNRWLLNYLLGVNTPDKNLLEIKQLHFAQKKMDCNQTLVNTIVQNLLNQNQAFKLQLISQESYYSEQLAIDICKKVGLICNKIALHQLPTTKDELNEFAQAWRREASLFNKLLLIDINNIRQLDDDNKILIAWLYENIETPIIFSVSEALENINTILTFTIPISGFNERKNMYTTLWAQAKTKHNIKKILENVAYQFSLNYHDWMAVQNKMLGYLAEHSKVNQAILQQKLWDFCREQARPDFGRLANRIVTNKKWDELVLPELEKSTLYDILVCIKKRKQVYQEWGLSNTLRRSMGVSTLFSGASGTGKTTAAEIIAHELQLDLYRIDLSAVMSKYIGETEKNLEKIFSLGEKAGGILLFDEADALFGKRSDVKDSHDRHANIEVSYLLQRIETYNGLVILTTNLKDALDTAFLRRIQFIIDFPFPNQEQRELIWRNHIEGKLPTEALNYTKMSRLKIAGGDIQNIIINAAFLAANADNRLNMQHIIAAAEKDYRKRNRQLITSDLYE